jgi:3-hydroxybutyrate dehydrogenase
MTDVPGMAEAKAALVTGAGSGIGKAIAERLTKDGWRVLGADLVAAHEPVEIIDADLTTRDGNRRAVDAALERFGRLDAVVANAGYQHVAPIAEFPEDHWDRLIALLLTSPFLLAKHAWQALCDAPDGGRFLVIASAHALAASPFKAAYVSAKHGVLGLVKTLALEGGPVGVSASALCPAYVRTPLVEKQIADQAKAHGIPEDRVEQEVILAPHALKRLLEPSEVADTAAFLLGPSGWGFSGAAVPLDCGWTAR